MQGCCCNPVVVLTVSQKKKCRRLPIPAYCECCEVEFQCSICEVCQRNCYFINLQKHLTTSTHISFVKQPSNWQAVEMFIEEYAKSMYLLIHCHNSNAESKPEPELESETKESKPHLLNCTTLSFLQYFSKSEDASRIFVLCEILNR